MQTAEQIDKISKVIKNKENQKKDKKAIDKLNSYGIMET